LILAHGTAWAAVPDGKGLGNLAYSPSEVGKTLSLIKNREGHGWVTMHRGYLVVIYSKDGGAGQGAISFVDVSDPRNPKLVHNRDDAETREIREPHGWGMRGDIACVQANYGMNFWDFSDVTAPKRVSYLRLPEITISDYDNGLWWTHWQGRYAYGGGSGNGIYIADAQDPANPKFIKRIPTSQTGGFRVGPTFAIGNLLVITGTDLGGISTFDIGDPENPRLLATTGGAISYSSMVNGGRLVLAGSGENDGFALVYDLSDPSRIRSLGKSSPGQADKGGYVGFADGFAFSGFSTKGFSKIDMSKPDFPVVQTGTSGLSGRDEDFAVPLGNLVFVGNDHPGQGSSLIPHQTAPDTQGPEVNMVVPADKAVNQPLTSRVGITLTDAIEGSSLTPENFIVRPVGAPDGRALEGWYATQSAIANFSPKEPLQPNTTYEVVVKAGGLADYVGNKGKAGFRSVFSTGPVIEDKPTALKPARPGRSRPEAKHAIGARAASPLFSLHPPGNGAAQVEATGRRVPAVGRVSDPAAE
jgi:hypothetical protein